MKVVLDANVLISSFFWGGNPRIVVERIIAGKDEFFVTKEILEEIKDVLGREKFHADKDAVHFFINSIEEIGNMIIPKKRITDGSRYKSDNKYLECGIAALVDFIVSGDTHLLELKEYGTIKIVSVKKYLEMVQ